MNAVAQRPSTDQLMHWLTAVADPEIPVLSIVDLGLVRKLAWEGDTCVVTITPTYSGCPAMQEIAADIKSVLQAQGLHQLRIDTQLSPAWTTDWMSPKGREQLQGYGIAPPAEKAVNVSGLMRRQSEVVVACPLCGSDHTRVISHFGSTACKALYRCQACGEPFDYFKAH